MITLPETDFQIKTLITERLQHPLDDLTQHDSGPDVQALSAHNPGSIVLRFNVHGILGVEILADRSDEEDTLRERLKAARPVLELLQEMFTVDTIGTKAEARRS